MTKTVHLMCAQHVPSMDITVMRHLGGNFWAVLTVVLAIWFIACDVEKNRLVWSTALLLQSLHFHSTAVLGEPGEP